MQYQRYHITSAPDLQEVLLAWLSELPFEAFEEQPSALIAYLPPTSDPKEIDQELRVLAEQVPFTFTREELPEQNWNEEWERNFQPVQVGTFCGIRAEFHPPFSGVRYELVIQPKMAFGTGHHETTYMMVAHMESIDFIGKRVLDYGCGTGILAILALQLGATEADGVDIEAASVENSNENALRNGVAMNLRIFEGTLEVVPPGTYDIILANINRNVILDSFPSLFAKLNSGGILLISGILRSDREQVFNAAIQHGFKIDSYTERGEWLAARLLSS